MDDPLANLPGYLLRRASATSLADLATCLAPLGVRPTDASILTLIAHNTDVTQSDIGNRLGIQRANMTPLIARMEEQGWITRQPRDGRSQGLALTEVGRGLQKQIWSEVERYESALVMKVPEEHRAHVIPVLTALWGTQE